MVTSQNHIFTWTAAERNKVMFKFGLAAHNKAYENQSQNFLLPDLKFTKDEKKLIFVSNTRNMHKTVDWNGKEYQFLLWGNKCEEECFGLFSVMRNNNFHGIMKKYANNPQWSSSSDS